MTMDLPVTGGCACGAIRYQCADEPALFLLCRCGSCRHVSGSAFAANVWFPAGSVTYTHGEPKEYVRVADTGQPARHKFCVDCGSPVGSAADAFAEIMGVPVGSLDDASELKPTANVWLSNKLSWDLPASDLPCFDRNLEIE